MPMKTVIMAGGRGTRISELFPDIPKPLIPVQALDSETNRIISRPVLEWELRSLVKQGYDDFIITVGYKAQQIIDYFSDGKELGCKIEYFVEQIPLGNAGALFKLRKKLVEPFLLLNADAVFDIDFDRFIGFHRKCQGEGGLVTLFTHPNSHPYDSGLVVTDERNAVVQWLTKEDSRPDYYNNRVNAGLHVLDPSVLDMTADRMNIDPEEIGKEKDGKTLKIDLDRHILKPLCGSGLMFAYSSPEYVRDMGTPERFIQVQDDYRSGVVNGRNLRHKQRAVFLDRDGTINVYKGFLRKTEDFELIDGVAEAIKRINRSGYLAIVVTNQPVIARGEVTVDELQMIHRRMETLLGKEGAYIDGLYYCPHHPDGGFSGEIQELKIKCECRKPAPGMLLRAASDYNISLQDSWMIGDGRYDIEAGKNAGCKTALIGEGEYGQTLTAHSLLEAVDSVLSHNHDLE